METVILDQLHDELVTKIQFQKWPVFRNVNESHLIHQSKKVGVYKALKALLMYSLVKKIKK